MAIDLTYLNRFEFKYIISLEQRDRILKRISPFCDFDKNVQDHDVGYWVSSLYYDSDQLQCFRTKVEGEKNRAKLRIRVYPPKVDLCSLELKLKENNNVTKQRVVVDYDLARYWLDSSFVEQQKAIEQYSPTEQETLNKVFTLHRFFKLRPQVVVSYRRIALRSKSDSRLRLTFDQNLRGNRNLLDPTQTLNLSSNDRGTLLLPPHLCVFEVKFNHFIPTWMIRVLQSENCSINKISKYCEGIAHNYHYAWS